MFVLRAGLGGACSVGLHAAGDTGRLISGRRSAVLDTPMPCHPSWPVVPLTISLVDWTAPFRVASRASTSSARRARERFARAGVMSTSWRSSRARSSVPSLQGSGPCTWVAGPRLYFTMWLCGGGGRWCATGSTSGRRSLALAARGHSARRPRDGAIQGCDSRRFEREPGHSGRCSRTMALRSVALTVSDCPSASTKPSYARGRSPTSTATGAAGSSARATAP